MTEFIRSCELASYYILLLLISFCIHFNLSSVLNNFLLFFKLDDDAFVNTEKLAKLYRTSNLLNKVIIWVLKMFLGWCIFWQVTGCFIPCSLLAFIIFFRPFSSIPPQNQPKKGKMRQKEHEI